jgi:hypothetical protein
MLIFDRLPSMERAGEFAIYCTLAFGRSANVYEDHDASDQVDPFPCKLTAPIVLVERDDLDAEQPLEPAIIESVRKFGGRFAGT